MGEEKIFVYLNPKTKVFSLSHWYLEEPPEIVFWIKVTFDYSLRIEKNFTQYLKESCWYCSDQYFSIKYFPNSAFACNISSKLSGCFWLLWVLMG